MKEEAATALNTEDHLEVFYQSKRSRARTHASPPMDSTSCLGSGKVSLPRTAWGGGVIGWYGRPHPACMGGKWRLMSLGPYSFLN